ncbi:MAG: prolyl oligopeptidase family serine peptidase [Candidatus Binatia bacterium]|nr:prolyl oligopeptidase family serine peptidase [Candidatus Binatia bacterium]
MSSQHAPFVLFLVFWGATGSEASVAYTASQIFRPVVGDAAGDTNADGRATAADLVGKVLGHKNPTEDGPYGTGFRRIDVIKPSETRAGESRRLLTSVWYPAAPGTFPSDSMPGGQALAPFAPDLNAPLPLLLFSHGSCGFDRQSIFLVRRLATWGFIVAAPPHPGNTTSEFQTCMTPAALAESFVNRPADIIAVLDRMLQENADPDSFWFRRINPERIGVLGHSFGGLTTLRVLARDARFIAGLALAPVVRTIQDEVRSVHQPTMIQVGTLDSLLADARLGYDLLAGTRMLVEIERMTHSPFSDFCLECTPESLSAAEAHLYALRFAVPFLLSFVGGDHRFALFLGPDSVPPGVRYLVDNNQR